MALAIILTVVTTALYLGFVWYFIWPGPLLRKRKKWLEGTLSVKKAASALETEIQAALALKEKEKGAE